MGNTFAKIIRIIQFIWLLPATILVWLFYILPLLLTKEITYKGMSEFLVFVFENPVSESWYDQQWKKWGGWSGPCVLIYKKDNHGNIPNSTVVIHELRHCIQQFKWGIFFYPAYITHSLWIYISNFLYSGMPWKKEKRHPYLDNFFERDARKAAGQRVDIPRSRWPDGKDDFNPWF